MVASACANVVGAFRCAQRISLEKFAKERSYYAAASGNPSAKAANYISPPPNPPIQL